MLLDKLISSRIGIGVCSISPYSEFCHKLTEVFHLNQIAMIDCSQHKKQSRFDVFVVLKYCINRNVKNVTYETKHHNRLEKIIYSLVLLALILD